jgi:arylsulfatase A-like enzyme
MPLNILIIVSDDQETGTINGHLMPRLSSDPYGSWRTYPNSALSTPVCRAHRVSMLTGQRADHHGVGTNQGGAGGPVPDSIFRAISQTGDYSTVAQIGKYINSGNWGIQPGYTFWWSYGGVGQGYYPNWAMRDENNTIFRPGDGPYDPYLTYAMRDQAIELMDDDDGAAPWCMYWAMSNPHRPFQCAPEHAELDMGDLDDPVDFDLVDPSLCTVVSTRPPMTTEQKDLLRSYRLDTARCLYSGDAAIGDMLDHLHATGQLDRTLVAYCNDNGKADGRKRLSDGDGEAQKKNPFRFTTDGLMKVRWPGATNGVDERLVSILDIPATALDVAGATPLHPIDGSSLRPILEDPDAYWPRTRVESFYVGDSGSNVGQPGTQKWPRWWSILDTSTGTRWNYSEIDAYGGGAFPAQPAQVQLFNLDVDPNELVSVHAEHPSICALLSGRLAELKSRPLIDFETGPPPTPSDATPRVYVHIDGKWQRTAPHVILDGEATPVEVGMGPSEPALDE